MAASDLITKVHNTIVEYNMLNEVDTVVVGLSGGADSVCLFEVLYELKDELELNLIAVHVHHGLRDTADRDEEYVRALCEERAVPFVSCHVDAAGHAAQNGESVEEAGRNLRYKAFEEAAKEAKNSRIAVAHHIEDLAETVVFNLARGSGITGLRGILPVNGRVIRPLLYVTRQEIEAFLIDRGLTWVTDETNDDTEITRNYIRKVILPEFTEHINEQTIRHIAEMSKDAAGAAEYIDEAVTQELKHCTVNTGARNTETVISVTKLKTEPVFLQKRMLLRMITDKAGRKKDISSFHVDEIRKLMEGTGSGEISLPYGLKAVREYDALRIVGQSDDREPSYGEFPKSEADYEIRVFSFDGCMDDIPRNEYTKWLDYDKIGALPVFRNRAEGDRITLTDDGHGKPLSKYMIDRKMPCFVRDKIVLPTIGNEILWVPGGRINAGFKVTEETVHVMEVRYKKSED